MHAFNMGVAVRLHNRRRQTVLSSGQFDGWPSICLRGRNKIAGHADGAMPLCGEAVAPFYFTRVQDVLRQNTTATHPASSTVFLSFTLTVPE